MVEQESNRNVSEESKEIINKLKSKTANGCRFIFLDIDGVIATPKTVEHGMWETWYENGQLQESTMYKNDIKQPKLKSRWF